MSKLIAGRRRERRYLRTRNTQTHAAAKSKAQCVRLRIVFNLTEREHPLFVIGTRLFDGIPLERLSHLFFSNGPAKLEIFLDDGDRGALGTFTRAAVFSATERYGLQRDFEKNAILTYVCVWSTVVVGENVDGVPARGDNLRHLL
jgi:hypothetical protein